MRRSIIDKFLPENYEYMMHIEDNQDGDTIQHEPSHVDKVFNKCSQPKFDSLLSEGDGKKLGYVNMKISLEDL